MTTDCVGKRIVVAYWISETIRLLICVTKGDQKGLAWPTKQSQSR